MTQDVDRALKELEARDRENAGPARRIAGKSIAYVRPKLHAVRVGGAKAVDAIEKGGAGYVAGVAALARQLQEGAIADADRAIDCASRVAAATSPAEAVAAQAGYVRAQFDVNVERWRMLAEATGAVAEAIDKTLLRRDR